MSYPALHLYIDGQWLGAEGRDSQAVVNPSTGEVLGAQPCASAADADAAVAAAARAFPAWRETSPYDRARILRGAASRLRERQATIGATIALELGKPIGDAIAEVGMAADVFDWFAEEGRRAYGRVIAARSRAMQATTEREPVGPCALLTPWNFPIGLPARKVAAALAAGCTAVLKPAAETPAAALAIAQALHDAGLPAGVLNVVNGDPVGLTRRLLQAPAIRKLSFTGSTAVGKDIARQAADTLKQVTMELGGHAAVLVLADADPEQAATVCAQAKFRNAGQVCTAANRFFVHASIVERFARRFAEVAGALRLGAGTDSATQMGPLAHARRLNAVAELVGDAVQRGARVLTGGQREDRAGFFWQPTVLTDVPADARVMHEEAFGPIAPIVSFTDLPATIAVANALPYGLAAYVFTESARQAREVSRALECGIVGINTFATTLPEAPFGGVKDSGYGSENGSEGLEAYLNTKFIAQV